MTRFVLPVSFWCCPSITENYSANTNIFNCLFQEHVWSRKLPCPKNSQQAIFRVFLLTLSRMHDFFHLKQKNLPTATLIPFCQGSFGNHFFPSFLKLHHGSPEKKDLQLSTLLQGPIAHGKIVASSWLPKFPLPGKAILCTHNLGRMCWCFLPVFPAADSQQMKPNIPSSWVFIYQIQTDPKKYAVYMHFKKKYIYICLYIHTHASFACFGLSLGHICDLKTHAVHLGPRIQHLVCRSSKLHGWCAWKAP